MRPPVTDYIGTEARFGAQNYEPLGVILSRGEGVWVWDTQGNRYLDCLSLMNKFRKLGLISYNGQIEVHSSLMDAVLREKPELKEGE
jgi:hypothetical protein